jgi:NAD(P)H dehydrogenase (quinone)
MYLVLGLTGKVGGTVARRLLEAGHKVRALLRDPGKALHWADRGVDLRQGDFTEVAGLAAALESVEGAFLMLPPFFSPQPGFPEAEAMVRCFREALDRSPPERVVALSSVGSQRVTGLGMITATHLLESGLADVPVPHCFVRPGSFLENYVPNLAQARSTGVFETYLMPTDRAVPMVATRDIGCEIAERLVTGWNGRLVVEIGSMISPDELAGAMGDVVGRQVQASAIPRERWEASLARAGMPPRFVAPFLEMEEGYNSGWIGFGAPDAERVSGRITPTQVFARAEADRIEADCENVAR